MSDDPSSLLAQLCDLAAAESLRRFRTDLPVENKLEGAFDPVTEADRAAERAIRDAALAAFPDHGFLGEEHGEVEGTAPWRWVVDPIDGTRAFVSGVPVWTTLIGLEHRRVLVAGAIAQPFTRERWIRRVDRPTTYERGGVSDEVRTSGRRTLGEARLMVTDMRAGQYLQLDEAEAIATVADRCRLCRQGLDAYGFALVASGQLDLVIEASLSWYDIAAVVPVIEGAGGVAVGWRGEALTEGFHRGRVIVAATPELAANAVRFLEHVE
ncbi:MAG: histidinol-phosphatase [Deltaproteobacteria bacterium]|nr:histidinol-phosphatase [Deltaproteobacteria bacterium]